MKTAAKFFATAAVTAAAMLSTQANAALVYTGALIQNGSTYIGTYDPGQADSAIFFDNFTVAGAFSDTIVFDINPAGQATMNANFVPTTFISGFMVNLYDVTSDSCGAVGASCGAVTTGGLLAAGVAGLASSNIGFQSLMAGRYAMIMSGTVTGTPVLVSGQLSTAVPEPGSLALAGLAILGLAAARRRKA